MNKTLESIQSTPNQLAAVEAPVRAQLLKELPKAQREQATSNLVESAMIMGLLDAYDIRVWLGLPRMSIRVITRVRDEVKERWLKESGNIVEYAKTERAIQIKRAWENVRKCEELFNDAKSTGDKVKVKQLELQYMQYIAKLSFVEQMVDSGTPETQVNVVAWSSMKDEKEDSND